MVFIGANCLFDYNIGYIAQRLALVTEVNVLEHLGNSYHNIIIWKLVCNVGLPKTRLPVREYHKANFGAMKFWFQGILYELMNSMWKMHGQSIVLFDLN